MTFTQGTATVFAWSTICTPGITGGCRCDWCAPSPRTAPVVVTLTMPTKAIAAAPARKAWRDPYPGRVR